LFLHNVNGDGQGQKNNIHKRYDSNSASLDADYICTEGNVLIDDKTSSLGATNLKWYVLSLCISILLYLVSGLQSPLFAQDDIRVSREKDKTVYSIDGNNENRLQQERERDKAWDMLKNMRIYGTQNQPTSARPAQPGPAQPVQPGPGK
jgi:hypothetical protein